MKYLEDDELGRLIQSKAAYYEAPQNLRDKISAALGQAIPPVKQHWAHHWLERRRWPGMGVAFACGAALGIAVTLFHGEPDLQNRIASQAIGGHVRSLMAAHLSDVASTDRHTVKPWFSGKLDYSPPVKDLAKEGFPLLGGRLDYMDERPVAALVYRHRLHTINVFVWPARDKPLPSTGSMSKNGFNVTSWQDDGMQYWAVSDLNTADLKRFAELLRKQPV